MRNIFKKQQKIALGLAATGVTFGVAGQIANQVPGPVGTNVGQALVQTSAFLPPLGTAAGGFLAIQETQKLGRLARYRKRGFP